ncbi:MAG: sulfatase [Planctomycetes bacterium]|nr:sulfatase [Planctomycetota bacterium]MCB9903910.1 sulfatase [Planctomycetota bacterium]
MMRRSFLLLALLVGTTSCGDDVARPDVVIVVVDTLRPDRLGAYGCDRDLTPYMDRVAAESAVFTDCQSGAPWTAPSLITLMTSTRPGVHGVTSFPVPGVLSPRMRTLAEELKEAGYATAAFTEGGYAQPSFGLGRGFDEYPEHPGDADGFHSNVEAPSRLNDTVDRALIWLAQEREQPRLLFVHTYEVHHPLRPPEPDLAALRPGYSEAAELDAVRAVIDRWNRLQTIDEAGAHALLRHSFHHDFANMPGILNPENLFRACAAVDVPLEKDRARLDDFDRQWLQDLYDAEVRFTDRELGRLFDALDRNPGPNGTVLVVTSDHGEGLGAFGRLGHGEVFTEELLRVLLMVRAPGVAPGVVDDLVRTIDVMPTLLALAQVEPEEPVMQGRNLLPVLQGSAAPSDHAVGQALSARGGRDPRRSIKRGDLRLVLNAASGERWLYDLAHDPGELHDIASERPEVARELEDMLREELRRDGLLRGLVGDPGTTDALSDDQLDELRRLGYVGD